MVFEIKKLKIIYLNEFQRSKVKNIKTSFALIDPVKALRIDKG
tara:strand:+ start:593 stop:721 length:129 start_codon:yes stop_codon:yes gene_type:complete